MIMLKDGFDAGAEEVFAAKARGEKLYKQDLARIMRTAVQAWQIAHPHAETRPPTSKRATGQKRPLSTALPRATYNALFDAMVSFEGITQEQLTKNGRFKITEAIEQILAVCPELSPEEIERRGNKYKSTYPRITPTAMGLCSNWASLYGGYSTKAAKLDLYVEPPNWRPYAAKINAELAKREWRDICVLFGAEIHKLMP